MDFNDKLGFSMIELIAALGLLGILLAIGVPAWNKWLLTYQLDRSARQVQTELQNIKMRAVAENLGFQFAYSTGSANYLIQRGGTTLVTKPLPEGIKISQAGTVSFSPRGTAAGNRIRLRNSDGLCKHVVVSFTGRIRVCKPNGCAGDC
ncbi:MAG: prepilin-type N-terminal cleavage/methylation domain-containing protein [Deltaproteobacteria bacterium]|nr:prepilin-type N-terminal cleavage/methylation domain-containing protein [Deltaproteobacteria bacterium]